VECNGWDEELLRICQLVRQLLQVWKVLPGGYTSRKCLETIPNNAPCSASQSQWLSEPQLVYLVPGWIPLGEMRPLCSEKLHPSDSIVGIGWCVFQIDRPGLLGNGSEWFPRIWNDDCSGTPNVSSPSVALPMSKKCAPGDPFVGIWWGNKQKMCLAFLSTRLEGNLWTLPEKAKSIH
jgi:hypothetical protein